MPKPLEIGVARTVKVRADQFWTDTGIALIPGRYRFQAAGRWSDWFIPSGPDGYHALAMLFFERQRRVAAAPWMALIGAIGRDDATAFVIGNGTECDIAAEGELCCFGNDLPTMYWNNQGEVELTVTLLSLAGTAEAVSGSAAAPETATAAPAAKPRKPRARSPKRSPAEPA
jgi:hypothetical protein